MMNQRYTNEELVTRLWDKEIVKDLMARRCYYKQNDWRQRELDELHPENVTDLRKLEIKIEQSGMNETARKEADKVLSRLKHEGQGAESALLYDAIYISAGVRGLQMKIAPEALINFIGAGIYPL